jgi:hypothetical protein
MTAPTVSLVDSSTRIALPVARLSLYGSAKTGSSVLLLIR